MYLPDLDIHLAYCTNIHPAETWPETQFILAQHTLAVKRRLIETGELAADAPFAIGLRLSARAAKELLCDNNLINFQHWLDQHHCYVFTINGFPYGNFHHQRVKENVYQPDWSTPQRLHYTLDLFAILAALRPHSKQLSVSTLPGSFKAFNPSLGRILEPLQQLAEHLDELSEQHQIDFHLGLEPEPLGLFENTSETLEFFARLSEASHDESLIKRRLGLNYDACHFAIEFESPTKAITAFNEAGIRISKVHASNALSLRQITPENLRHLRQFIEPTYLHQVISKSRNSPTLTRFVDLPEALNTAAPENTQQPPTPTNHPHSNADHLSDDEWRIHFHIPLSAAPAAPLDSTADHLRELCQLAKNGVISCQHWEIETYTWNVLPPSLQAPVTEQITSEYRWLRQQLKN